jgi:predicted nucleotidyltransferase
LSEERYRYYTMSEEERKKVLDRLREILAEHGVELAIVFGSFTYAEEFRDIDIAVYSKKMTFQDLLKLGVDLELELGLPVDVAPLDQLPPRFRLNVLLRGVVLLEKPGLYERLYMQTQDELMQAETSTKRQRLTDTPSV